MGYIDAEELLSKLEPMRFYAEYGCELNGKNVNCTLPGHDDKNPSLSIDSATGLFNCFGCNRKGNMIQWFMYFHNLDFKTALESICKKFNIKSKNRKFDPKMVEICHDELTDEMRLDLNARGIRDEVINEAKLGKLNYKKKDWLSIPIQNVEGKFIGFKLRIGQGKDKEFCYYPSNIDAQLYGYEIIEECSSELLICEGEIDALVARSKGIYAVAVPGAGIFKREWIEPIKNNPDIKRINVCTDNDLAGERGSEKILGILHEELKDKQLVRIKLPEEVGEGGDITDYFIKLKGNKEDLFTRYAKPFVVSDNPERIKKIDRSNEAITFKEWQIKIKNNFPDYLFAAEVIASIMTQILINDITNPFGLVLVDVPSAGKTITINFFAGIEGLSYSTDKFTPASFVSNASNVSKEKLAEIDLLPRIRNKLFLVRDLAPLFGERDDDLLKSLGILTRVFDGEGLQTDSGIHGQRQYVGEYLFMFVAGSTPIQPRVWKQMGNLGARLFFLNMNSRDKSESELANQLIDASYKQKEKECRVATKNFLHTLWQKYQNGIDWDKKQEEPKNLLIVARCAMLLAKLRGTINVWKERTEDGQELSHTSPVVEKPDRINQLFYNLSRGHALINGRTQINKDDLKPIIELAVDSAPTTRAQLFRKLIEKNGQMTTKQVEVALRCSNTTALKEMEKLKILGVVCETISSIGSFEKTVKLTGEFEWFLTEECKEIRGLPLPARQHTVSDLLNQSDAPTKSDTVMSSTKINSYSDGGVKYKTAFDDDNENESKNKIRAFIVQTLLYDKNRGIDGSLEENIYCRADSTNLDRKQVMEELQQLVEEGMVRLEKDGAHIRYKWVIRKARF